MMPFYCDLISWRLQYGRHWARLGGETHKDAQLRNASLVSLAPFADRRWAARLQGSAEDIYATELLFFVPGQHQLFYISTRLSLQYSPKMSSFTDKIKAAVKGDVKEGAKLNTGIKLKEHNPENADVSLDGLTGKSIIVGVPGAFTP